MEIAHRGYSEKFKDNTIISFVGALTYNFDIIEMDIQITKDNKIIVYHDLDIINSYGETKFIFDMNYSEIISIDADIPLLCDVLKIIGGKIPIYLDIKGSEKIIVPLIMLLDAYMDIRILVASFNILIIDGLHKLRPNYNYGIISETMLTEDLTHSLIEKYQIKFFSFQWSILNKDVVQFIQKKRVMVFAYTNKNNYTLEKIKEFDIDGIVTNYKLKE